MAETLESCRTCQHDVSSEAKACPNCGCIDPAKSEPQGYGFEYKSPLKILGMPLIHISFKYTHQRRPVVARGFIAIGQFAVGVISIGQLSLGVFSLGQLSLAYAALCQVGLAAKIIAQIGMYIFSGYGQIVISVAELLAKFNNS